MERTVLCLNSSPENGAGVKATHREVFANGLLLTVEAAAHVYEIAYTSYPGGMTTHTLSTRLQLECRYRLYHYGREIATGQRLWHPKRMTWTKKEVLLLPLLSIGDLGITFYLEGTGKLVRDMPPLDVVMHAYMRRRKADRDKPAPEADEVRLPKRLIVRINSTGPAEAAE